MKPTIKQLEQIAFELFNADFGGQMVQLDWDWVPERIKSRYRTLGLWAIRKWEEIREEEQNGNN